MNRSRGMRPASESPPGRTLAPRQPQPCFVACGQAPPTPSRSGHSMPEAQATPQWSFASPPCHQSLPGLPRAVRVTPTGATSVDVNWEPPLSDGASAITHYQVCVIDAFGTPGPYEDTEDTATEWRIRGLAIGHTYGFRVRAVNGVGTGPSTARVDAIPTRAVVPTRLTRPATAPD